MDGIRGASNKQEPAAQKIHGIENAENESMDMILLTQPLDISKMTLSWAVHGKDNCIGQARSIEASGSRLSSSNLSSIIVTQSSALELVIICTCDLDKTQAPFRILARP